MSPSRTRTSSDPRISLWLMGATYLVGGLGIAIAFSTLGDTPATLDWGCLLAVGASGVLSFVRHSVFHRSDAARMNWDLGVRNNFQIEVGLANLAWGLVAILTVLLDLGLAAQATTFLVFGFYLLGVVMMQVISPGGKRRSPAPLIAMAAFGMMLALVGILGMNAA